MLGAFSMLNIINVLVLSASVVTFGVMISVVKLARTELIFGTVNFVDILQLVLLIFVTVSFVLTLMLLQFRVLAFVVVERIKKLSNVPVPKTDMLLPFILEPLTAKPFTLTAVDVELLIVDAFIVGPTRRPKFICPALKLFCTEKLTVFIELAFKVLVFVVVVFWVVLLSVVIVPVVHDRLLNEEFTTHIFSVKYIFVPLMSVYK
jgi:hypothetical protein